MRDVLLSLKWWQWFFILLAVCRLVYWNIHKSNFQKAKPSKPSSKSNAGSVNFNRLVTATYGDRRAAERLVYYEGRRNPGISRDEAIQRAFDSLTDDRAR